MSTTEPLVHIEVTVNVNDMRRGQRRIEALTPRLEALEMAGYIKILGHVNPPAAPVPEPTPPLASKAANPRRVKAKAPVEVTVDGDSQGPA